MSSRLLAACGTAFVVLTLAGNTLTESAVDPDAERSGARASADLAGYADSVAAQVGVGLEVFGLTVLVLFAAAAAVRLRPAPVAAAVTCLGTGVLVAVKLASGAPLLVGVADHELVSDDVALALVSTNEAAFVLCWTPFALVIGALASGLRRIGVIGRPTAAVGGVLAVLGVVAALLGLRDVNTAMPVPFLLSLLWLAVASGRLAIARQDAQFIPEEEADSAWRPIRTAVDRG